MLGAGAGLCVKIGLGAAQNADFGRCIAGFAARTPGRRGMTFYGVLRLVRSLARYKELSQLGRRPTIEMAFRGYSETSQGIGPSSTK
jgi:hypothetical protein